MIFFGNLRVLG